MTTVQGIQAKWGENKHNGEKQTQRKTSTTSTAKYEINIMYCDRFVLFHSLSLEKDLNMKT